MGMALLYPWATKEYLLWEMSIGQIVMYMNLGVELNSPQQDNASRRSLANMSLAERRATMKSLREQGYIKDREQSDANKQQFADKYGDV